MTALFGFYFGGAAALALSMVAEAAIAEEDFAVTDLLFVLAWPLSLICFFVDVMRGWRP